MSDSLDALLIKLHEEWKPIEALKAIRTELDVSLSEAKQVSARPSCVAGRSREVGQGARRGRA
jgi:ribosomal protein L7/L12